MALRTGTPGNDTLLGTNLVDTLRGLGGNDRLEGKNGNDRLEGAAGNDTLIGGLGVDKLLGGAGNDTYEIDSAAEIDKAVVDAGIDTVKSTVTYVLGANQEHLTLVETANINGTGNTGANILLGNAGNNTLSGLGGNDTLTGNNGNDNLLGAAGNDTLSGGAGNDTLNSGTGNDTQNGGAGNDTLIGSTGDDRLLGGAGNDTATFDVADTRGVDGGTGADMLKVGGDGTLADLVTLNSGTVHFSNFEIIDLSAAGVQTVTMDLSTLFGLSDTDIVTIKGGADVVTAVDNIVNADGNDQDGYSFLFGGNGIWTNGGIADVGGTLYQHYENNGARVLMTLDIDFSSFNNAVLAVNDNAANHIGGFFDTPEQTSFTTGDVLANDADPNQDVLSVVAADTVSTLGVTLTNNGDGTFVYAAAGLFDSLASGESIADTFTYTVSDGHGESDTGTVTITINGVNDAVDAVGDGIAVDEDATTDDLVSTLLGNDTDIDTSDTRTIIAVTQGGKGAVSWDSNSTSGTSSDDTLTYVANASELDALAVGESTTDTFTYTVSDGHGSTDTATVTVTINGMNDGPVAIDDTASVNEDGTTASLATSVLSNDTNIDNGDTRHITAVTQGAKGSVSWNDNGTPADSSDDTLTYSADDGVLDALVQGETTTDSFTYTIEDEHGAASTATVTLTITGVNDIPDAVDDSGTISEFGGGGSSVFPLSNDTDPDTGDTATLSMHSFDSVSAAGGSVTDIGGGSLQYEPEGNFSYLAVGESATDTFTYTVQDTHGATDTATVTMTVTGMNQAPTAVDDMDTTDEDTALIINVLANDLDPDLSELADLAINSFSPTSAAGATIQDNGDGTFDYFPAGHFDDLAVGESTTDTFTYSVVDPHSLVSFDATVTVTITGVNDPVIADNDAVSISEDATATDVTATALDGDEDLDDSDSQTVTAFDATGTDGAVTLVSGVLSYNPNGAFEGLADGESAIDTFTYSVSDGHGSTDIATVTVTINGQNDPVTADDDAISVSEDSGSTDITTTVLTGDTDIDGSDTQTVTAFDATGTTGVVTLVSDVLRYNTNTQFESLAVGETDIDTFSYTVSDGHGSTDTATVTMTITGQNDAVNADDDTASVNEDATTSNLAGSLLSNDDDPDGSDTPDIISVTQGSNSTVTWNDNGTASDSTDDTLTYAATGTALDALAAGETTTDSFTYTISDGHGSTDTATVTVTITGVNDPVDAVNDTASVNEDATNANLAGLVLDNDDDPDTSDTPDIIAVTPGTNGTVTWNDNSTASDSTDDILSYAATGSALDALAVGETTTDTFTYTISDGHGSTDTATVTVTITGVNDVPVADDDSVSVNEDATTGNLTATLLDGDTDVDHGSFFTFLSVSQGSKGSTSWSNSGTPADPTDDNITYTANGAELDALAVGETTTDTFTYILEDNDSGVGGATVTVTITGVNDTVNADDDTASVNEDATTSNLATSVLSNDDDTDTSDTPDIISVTQGTNGTVTWNDNGTASNSTDDTLTYAATGSALDALAAGETTTDSFTYTISDGHGSTDTATVTVTITGVNDDVNADDDTASVNEDATTTNLTTSVLSNDDDPDTSDTPDIISVTQGTNGTVTWNDNGTASDSTDDTLTYAATGSALDALAAGETTTDSFTYTISDGHGSTDTATVTVTITGVNDDVNADDDTASVNEDATTTNLATSVLSNDDDPDASDTPDIISVTQGTNGTVTWSDNGTASDSTDDTLTYAATGSALDALAAGETTTDSFTYTISDGHGSTDTATVTVTITGVNDAVNADDDTASVNEDATTTNLATSVLSNDEDPDTTDTPDIISVTQGTNGTVTWNDNGTASDSTDDTLTYAATGSALDALAVGETTTDSFTYTISDGHGSTDTATVTVTITGVNDAVNADDDTASVNEDATTTNLTTSVLSNDDDPDASDTPDIISVTQGTNGTVTWNDNGTASDSTDDALTYAADGSALDALAVGETTTDSFTYTISDGHGSTDTATVTVTVHGVNDAPVIGGDLAATVAEGATYTVTTSDLGEQDPDDSGTGLTYKVTNVTDNGTLKLDGAGLVLNDTFTQADVDAGDVTYQHGGGDNSADAFSFTLADGGEDGAGTDNDTFTFTVTAVNDAPVAVDDSLSSVAEDSGMRVISFTSLTGNDDDGDAGVTQTLTITAVGNAEGGSVVINGSNIEFTPTANFNGTASFDYTLQDNGQSNGVDDFQTDTGSVSFSITAVNDAPVNTVPGGQSTTLLHNKVIAGVSISDDSGSEDIEVTLSVDKGSLSLSQVTGLSFEGVADGTNDESMTFTGTLAEVNAALNNLVYHAIETIGTATITLATDDLGNTGTGGAATDTDTISVSVSVMSTLSLSVLDGANGFRLDGISASDASGFSVSSAGDVNGDGFGDVIVGAHHAETAGYDAKSGESYVVFGHSGGFTSEIDLSALNGSNGFRLDGINTCDFSGNSVSSAGDVNGDGFDDLLVGARRGSHGGFYQGEVNVVFGGASFGSDFDLSALNGNNGFRLDGTTNSDYAGHSVSNAGDVNGDGFADLLIGAPYAEAGGINDNVGESYVVFGKAAGFASVIGLSALNGTDGFRLDGIDLLDYSGISVSDAGDVNGDGFADLLIGAWFGDGGATSSGESYVVFGGSSFSSDFDLTALNGSNGFRLDGIASNDYSGESVSSAGDINRDGYDDLLIGARSANALGDSDAGQGYVVFGGSTFGSDFDLSALNGSNGFRLDGITSNDRAGWSVSTAGDVNGDGFDDILIGAPYVTFPNRIGETYLIFGKAGGFGSSLDLNTLNGTIGFKLSGIDNGDWTGRSVSSAGDVDGDGFDDLIIGAPGQSGPGPSPSPTNPGESYVIFGTDFRGEIEFRGGDDNDTLTGTGADEQLIGEVGNDTLNGGGGNDVLTGGAGNDIMNGDAGLDFLRGGTGNDTLNGGDDSDRLEGDEGADTLDGGLGNDTLDGGSGNDIFVFNDATGATNVDIIEDFGGAGATALDLIHLENAIFDALTSTGVLDAEHFVSGVGPTAAETDDHILYDTATGQLYYDPTGNATASDEVLIAVFATDPDGLNASDFVVI